MLQLLDFAFWGLLIAGALLFAVFAIVEKILPRQTPWWLRDLPWLMEQCRRKLAQWRAR